MARIGKTHLVSSIYHVRRVVELSEVEWTAVHPQEPTVATWGIKLGIVLLLAGRTPVAGKKGEWR
jgi:hypothetical protein